MKTSELTGQALDWAVAKCEGMLAEPWLWGDEQEVLMRYKFSTNWEQGGAIIQREHIALWSEGYDWEAKQYGQHESWGQTPLIAAMRCYVASKLGDEVDIPTELTQGESK